MLKKWSNLFAGVFFIAAGIVIALQIPSIRVMKVAMDSKLLPKVCVVFLVGFGIVLVLQDLLEFWRNNRQNVEGAPVAYMTRSMTRVNVLRGWLCVVLFGIFILLLRPAGFIVAGIFYLLTTFFVVTPKEKWKSVWLYVWAIVVPVVVFMLFVHVFRVLLPSGTIW
jgi:putative tricarboxylic transport membrane protein